jgi:N utilization substance protein B
LERNITEFGPGLEEANKDFIRKLANGVLANMDYIDAIIEKAAPEWPIDQITVVDRNVLRLGLFELIYGNKEEVPPKVAINEAIELAKNFSGESSGKFVNGVLGTVYRELETAESTLSQEPEVMAKEPTPTAEESDNNPTINS